MLLFSIPTKTPNWHFRVDGGKVLKVITRKGVSCDTLFIRSPDPHHFDCHPYVKSPTPKRIQFGTYKISSLHPYPKAEDRLIAVQSYSQHTLQ